MQNQPVMINFFYLLCVVPFLSLIYFERRCKRAQAYELAVRKSILYHDVERAKASTERARDNRFYAIIWSTVLSAIIWVVVEFHILATLAA